MEYKFVGVNIVKEEFVYRDATENPFSFATTTGNGSSSDAEKKAEIKSYYQGIFKREEEERPQGEWCKSPAFNPFTKEALSVWNFEETEKCMVKRYGRIENGRLVIPDGWMLIKQARITYIHRGRKRLPNGKLDIPKKINDLGLEVHRRYKYTDVNNEDFHVNLSEPIYLDYHPKHKGFVSEKLTEDFLMLEMLMKNDPHEKDEQKVLTEYHAHIHDPVKVCRRQDGSDWSKLKNFKSQLNKKGSFSENGIFSKKQQEQSAESSWKSYLSCSIDF